MHRYALKTMTPPQSNSITLAYTAGTCTLIRALTASKPDCWHVNLQCTQTFDAASSCFSVGAMVSVQYAIVCRKRCGHVTFGHDLACIQHLAMQNCMCHCILSKHTCSAAQVILYSYVIAVVLLPNRLQNRLLHVQSMPETMRIVSEAMRSEGRQLLRLDDDDFIDDAIDMDQKEQMYRQSAGRPSWPPQ